MDAQDLGSPPRQAPPDLEHPPLTPTTIGDPDLLQGRAPDTSLGWYRLQGSWTKLTVKALRDLASPGQGLQEAIVDLVLGEPANRPKASMSESPPSSGARP